MGWFLAQNQLATKMTRVKDFARYPELCFLNRYDVLVPTILAVEHVSYLESGWESVYPTLGYEWMADACLGVRDFYCQRSGMEPLRLIRCHIVLVHKEICLLTIIVATIFFLRLLTLGEGWHNNHHQYLTATARQGFRWWEIDITYYLLRGLQLCGLIWDIRPVPAWVLKSTQSSSQADGEANSEKIAV